MGSGGSKTHESFTVSTTASAVVGQVQDFAAITEQKLQGTADLGMGYHKLQLVLDTAAPGPGADLEDLVNEHAQLTTWIHEAQEHSAAAAAAGVDTSELDTAIKSASLEYLNALETEQLQALAAASGFAHPHLVGLSGKAQHPLVHYLDPAYPADSASKAKIAVVADERYAQLAAGEEVGGLSHAQVQDLEASLPGKGPAAQFPPWQASPAEAVAAITAVSTATLAYTSASTPDERKAAFEALIAAENTLATADCPDLGPVLPQAQAAGKAQVDTALYGLTTPVAAKLTADLVAHAQDAGHLDENAGLLTGREQMALLRATTGEAERTAVEAAAAARAAQLTQYKDVHAALSSVYANKTLTLPPLGDPPDPVAAAAHASLLKNAPQAYASWAKASEWLGAAAGAAAVKAELGAQNGCPEGYPAQLTDAYKTWAKQQPLKQLRAAAAGVGLNNPETANRQQVTNYLCAQWSAGHGSPQSIQAAVDAKHAAKQALKAAPPSAAPQPPPAVPAPAPAAAAAKSSSASTGKSPASWSSKHLALVAALKHHAASTSPITARHDPQEVKGWAWVSAGSAGHLGGYNTKTLLQAPDGTQWMFKPDTKAGGARSHAESAASRVFHAVGIPSVDVHVVKHGGHTGSAQPLLDGVTPLSPSPSGWTQADVDSIVRYHVGAWAVSDHDGKPDNVLRTSDNGLIPCDQGQSFKFFGSDTLDTGYTPSVGNAVYNVAYSFAKSGGLAPGVTVRPEAALPVLKAFEALPDSRYRDLLRSTAAAGVKNNVAWVGRMRAAAAKDLGVTAAAVTPAQVAERFLDAAVARKNTLRKDFTAFFAGLGYADGAAKLAHLR